MTIRVALIGCGGHMFETLLPSMRWTTDSIVAACDIDEARLARFTQFYYVPAAYRDYRELLDTERPDAVIVAVDAGQHAEIAEAVMRSGAHVFVEKSPCATADEAIRLAEVQKETGKWMMVGWQRRFMPSFRMAREIVHRAEFGGVQMFESSFHAKPYKDDAYFRINHVIHHLDVARCMMGEIELTQVQRVAVDEHMIGYTISFHARHGGIGTIQSGSFVDHSHPTERVRMLGRGRSVAIDNFRHVAYFRPSNVPNVDLHPYHLADGGDALVWDQGHRFDPRTTHRGFEAELQHFLKCAAEGARPESDISDSIETMKLFETMIRLIPKQAN